MLTFGANFKRKVTLSQLQKQFYYFNKFTDIDKDFVILILKMRINYMKNLISYETQKLASNEL